MLMTENVINVMNTCCSGDGGCCAGITVQVSIGGCCCAANNKSMAGCCQVLRPKMISFGLGGIGDISVPLCGEVETNKVMNNMLGIEGKSDCSRGCCGEKREPQVSACEDECCSEEKSCENEVSGVDKCGTEREKEGAKQEEDNCSCCGDEGEEPNNESVETAANNAKEDDWRDECCGECDSDKEAQKQEECCNNGGCADKSSRKSGIEESSPKLTSEPVVQSCCGGCTGEDSKKVEETKQNQCNQKCCASETSVSPVVVQPKCDDEGASCCGKDGCCTPIEQQVLSSGEYGGAKKVKDDSGKRARSCSCTDSDCEGQSVKRQFKACDDEGAVCCKESGCCAPSPHSKNLDRNLAAVERRDSCCGECEDEKGADTQATRSECSTGCCNPPVSSKALETHAQAASRQATIGGSGCCSTQKPLESPQSRHTQPQSECKSDCCVPQIHAQQLEVLPQAERRNSCCGECESENEVPIILQNAVDTKQSLSEVCGSGCSVSKLPTEVTPIDRRDSCCGECEDEQGIKQDTRPPISTECGSGCGAPRPIPEESPLLAARQAPSVSTNCGSGCCAPKPIVDPHIERRGSNCCGDCKTEEPSKEITQAQHVTCSTGCCAPKSPISIKIEDPPMLERRGSGCCGDCKGSAFKTKKDVTISGGNFERHLPQASCCEPGVQCNNQVVGFSDSTQDGLHLRGGLRASQLDTAPLLGEAIPRTKQANGCKSCCCGTNTAGVIEPKGKGKATTEPPKCSKGCCKEDIKEVRQMPSCAESTPVMQIKETKGGCCDSGGCGDTKVAIATKDACAKGCCTTESKPTQVNESKGGCCDSGGCGAPTKDVKDRCSAENEKAGGCCDDEGGCSASEVGVAICCAGCWNGICCHAECCLGVCCLNVNSSSTSKSKWPFSLGKLKKQKIDEAIALVEVPTTDSTSAPETVAVQIGGMTCTDCAAAIHKCLTSLSGVLQSDITYVTGRGKITFNTAVLDKEKIHATIKKLGFSSEEVVQGNDDESKFEIKAAKDGIVVSDLVRAILALKGVTNASIDIPTRSLRITHDQELVSRHNLAQCMRNQGWTPVPSKKAVTGNAELLWSWKWRFYVGTALSIPIVIFSYILPAINATNDFIEQDVAPGLRLGVLICWILATPIQFWLAAHLYASAVKSLWYAKKANVDTLVMLSSTTAYIYSVVSVFASLANKRHEGASFFETCAILLTLIMLGRYVETYAKEKTKKMLTQLSEVPHICTVINADGTQEQEEVEWIGTGDVMLVVPGDKILADSVVVFGESEVDESMLTGEALPVPKKLGDSVYSGAINRHGAMHIRAIKSAHDSTLVQIRKLVDEANASRANLQRTTDQLASYFCPFILVVTAIVFFSWIGYGSPPLALQFGVTVLVVACPCALALAVPTAVMSGMEVGARLGVLFKGGGAVLETLHSAQVVVFDKTGTLTRGTPRVVSHQLFITPPHCTRLGGSQCNGATSCSTCGTHMLFKVAGSAEKESEHLIGKAIVKHAQEVYCCEPSSVEEFQYTPGKGILCNWNNQSVCIGTKKWMQENRVDISLQADSALSQGEGRGETVVCVAINNFLVGSISLMDTPKLEARSVVQELKRMGMEVWVISGDNVTTTTALADHLGITNVMGGVLPAMKAEKVRELQGQGKRVVMVGDGINDSPALAQAEVGLAIGAGTDIAIDAAGVVLMRNNLHDVIVALDLSHKTFTRIKINLGWALAYNVIAILIAAGAFHTYDFEIPPSLAGAAELVSSIPVLISSFLLIYYSPPKNTIAQV